MERDGANQYTTTSSSPPDLHHGPDILPAHRTYIHLSRTLVTRDHMAAIVEQRVHFAFVADLAQLHLFVCDFKGHGAFTVSLPLFEATDVDVAGFGVCHLALTVGLSSFPLACVSVAVGIVHGAMTRFYSGDKSTAVGVARMCNDSPLTVENATFKRSRFVVGAEIGARKIFPEKRRILVSFQISEVTHRCQTFAFGFKRSDPEIERQHFPQKHREKERRLTERQQGDAEQ